MLVSRCVAIRAAAGECVVCGWICGTLCFRSLFETEFLRSIREWVLIQDLDSMDDTVAGRVIFAQPDKACIATWRILPKNCKERSGRSSRNMCAQFTTKSKQRRHCAGSNNSSVISRRGGIDKPTALIFGVHLLQFKRRRLQPMAVANEFFCFLPSVLLVHVPITCVIEQRAHCDGAGGGDLRRNGIGTRRKNITATNASRTLPPVEHTSVAPAVIKSEKLAASTQLVEFAKPQAASTLVVFVEGQSIEVSEISTHLASCQPQSDLLTMMRAIANAALTDLSWKIFPFAVCKPQVVLELLMIRAAMSGATQELPLSVTS